MILGLVSVIIPTYNRPNYLREAVDSVFAQTYPFIEILVIDDGSSEGGALTKSALKPYLSADSLSSRLPKVTYLYQKNCGLVPAVNRGLALARGEYIQRLDDDDRLLPEKIARSVNAFQAHPAVGLVATGYYHIDAVGKRIHTCPPRPCPESHSVVEYADVVHLCLCGGDGAFTGPSKGRGVSGDQGAGLRDVGPNREGI